MHSRYMYLGAEQEVAEALVGGQSGALAGVAERCSAQLNEVVGLVRGELSSLNRCACMLGVHPRHVSHLPDSLLAGSNEPTGCLRQLGCGCCRHSDATLSSRPGGFWGAWDGGDQYYGPWLSPPACH